MNLRLNYTGNRILVLIAVIWLSSIVTILAFTGGDEQPREPVLVPHWTSSHLTREGLLPEMAEQFNEAGHQTRSGRPIEVQIHNVPPALQAEYLVCRVTTNKPCLLRPTGIPIDPDIPDPVIVTPSSAHWFIKVNYEVGRNVVDLDKAPDIVRPFIGIVTYQEMAECLGWPQKELGYADILDLRADPEGWGHYECAKAEWGQIPLVAFTDPTTSSTGRSLLLSLYAIASGKAPEDLTLEDVNDPEVVEYVKEFQGLIDHYAIGTTVLNTKIYQGPRYGHFFIMPEDNLINLYQGTEEAYIGGKLVTAPPIDTQMVMIYPKEGAMPRSNCACVVEADWVTDEQVEAAQQWIDFILDEEQQRSFVAAGFRPGADIPLTEPFGPSHGLDPRTPAVIINPSLIEPSVAAAIDESWEDVKRPGVVTLVVDASSSMMGGKLRQAADGVENFLDNTSKKNKVGLVVFNESVTEEIPVGPILGNRVRIADTVREAQARGQSSLYDAIKAGIEMTDAAIGEPNAIRGVVVLTDGKATIGDTRLHDLIEMRSRSECLVEEEWDKLVGYTLVDQCTGLPVDVTEVTGIRLSLKTSNDIQIFFIGIGENVDLEVGRLLAQASGAEYEGAQEKDLPNVIENFSGYF